MSKLVKMISRTIKPGSKPVVYLSGGIDSAIILHHLTQKTDELISTYTFGFVGEDNEFDEAQRVADFYNTQHREILIENMLFRFSEILKHFDRPRFNLWVYWLAEAAKRDGCETSYVGEGADEHFGGYGTKPWVGDYTRCWADHYIYIMPSYRTVHRVFGLRLEAPFTMLDFRETLPYWDPKGEKTLLREAYKDVLPDFVVQRPKNRGGPNWRLFWTRELSRFYPSVQPRSDEEIRNFFNDWTVREWLKTQLPQVKEKLLEVHV